MNRGPVFERDALALEQGISYHSIIRDSVASSQLLSDPVLHHPAY